MLFTEFQERMNRPVDKADFEKASFIYMQSELDEDAFCKSYQEIINNPLCLLLVNDLANNVSALRTRVTRVEDSEANITDYASQLMSIANDLWDIEGAANAVRRLNRIGRNMLGDREYFRRKLSLGYELDLKERTEIAELI